MLVAGANSVNSPCNVDCAESQASAAIPIEKVSRLLQIATEVKKYKNRNPGWHGPKSVKKRVG